MSAIFPYFNKRPCRRNKTGVVGVHLRRVTHHRGGVVVVRRFYRVTLGKSKRNFPIDTLGEKVALQEATRCRAEWERGIEAHAPARVRHERAQNRRWMAEHTTPEQRRAYYYKNQAALLAGQKRRRAAKKKGGAR